MNSIFYKSHVSKPMPLIKILQPIDKNPVIFKDWGYKFNCVKPPCYWYDNDPIARYVCYKLYTWVLI